MPPGLSPPFHYLLAITTHACIQSACIARIHVLTGFYAPLSLYSLASSGISAKTIDTHRSRLMKKLNVRNIGELIKFGLNHGFTPPEEPDSTFPN
ncbi:MAG TPA: LuxR C-terminal-related transcriptional regulator, partial [Dehalococcoidia bacterium]|nr:LuxR C-terminal-related transcriptional regulator [Dehalococcoidia bacterium]